MLFVDDTVIELILLRSVVSMVSCHHGTKACRHMLLSQSGRACLRGSFFGESRWSIAVALAVSRQGMNCMLYALPYIACSVLNLVDDIIWMTSFVITCALDRSLFTAFTKNYDVYFYKRYTSAWRNSKNFHKAHLPVWIVIILSTISLKIKLLWNN